ncbi:MAG: VCBS repeat-containing protein [Nitrosopumilus sp.]|nr:FG-GAP-like repeat-containing protein [Nitrosopumilus sp.]NRA06417.1 VCBS repeat-containing protein [Nitrosopumilus sp.]
MGRLILSALIGIVILGGLGFADNSFGAKDNEKDNPSNGGIPQGKPFQNLEGDFIDDIANLQGQLDAFDLASLFEIFTQISAHDSDVDALQEKIDQLSSRLSFLETVLDDVNVPPIVDAGNDQHTRGSMTLTGSASDDGLASPLTYLWSQQSGPGTTTFVDATSLVTDVSFSDYGQYVLKLSVFDGLQTVSDTVTISYSLNQNFIVSSSNTDANVGIFLSNDDGTFESVKSYDNISRANGVAVGDFNEDGNLDIVTANYFDNTVNVLLSLGDNTYGEPTSFATDLTPISVAVGDFNEDGHLDIISSNSSYTVSVLLGNGDGTFSTHLSFSTYSNTGIDIGDFNGDGHLDFVSVQFRSSYAYIYLGNGDGTFDYFSYLYVNYQPISVAVGDFNGDGDLDFVTGNYYSRSVTTLLGIGDGTFGSQTTIPAGSDVRSIAVGMYD